MRGPLLLAALAAAFCAMAAADCECPVGWTAVAGGGRPMCYRAFDGPLAASAAAADCGEQVDGGTLASVASAEEHAAVIEQAKGTRLKSAFAERFNTAKLVYVGLRKTAAGQWANPDGADAAFVLTQWNKDTGQPSGSGNCVEMSGRADGYSSWDWRTNKLVHTGRKAGGLNDVPCGGQARPYVCGAKCDG